MKKRRQEFLKSLEDKQGAIRSLGVRSLALFGSWVCGQETKTSDLDFVVEFEKNSFNSYMDLKDFLERLFECRVDLVLANSIKPGIRAEILGEAIKKNPKNIRAKTQLLNRRELPVCEISLSVPILDSA